MCHVDGLRTTLRPASDRVRLAERDLIRDRFGFFAVVWLATSVLWLYALARGSMSPLDWVDAVVIEAAQAAILLIAVRRVRRTTSPDRLRVIVLTALVLLGFVWTAAASLTATPLYVLVLLLPVLILVPPLFFAWSWQVELVLVLALGAQAWLWLESTGHREGVALTDLVVAGVGGSLVAVALAARVSGELRIRLARREQEEEARRALDQSRADYLESEERFRVAFDCAPIGLVLVDTDGRVLQVNAAFERMAERRAEEIVGTPVDDFVHPEDRVLARAQRARITDESTATPESVVRLRRRDGSERWARVTRALARDGTGKPSYMIAQVEDVTERYQAEEALRSSLEELRQREEQLRLLAQRQVRVREEERRRLGFDLHDDVCQDLVGTGIMVESVRGRLQATDPEASRQLARVSGHLNDLGEHLRLVARELRPVLLHDLGLEDSVRSLASGLSSATTRVSAIFPTSIPRLSEDMEVAVYRIVQEAITNAIRHAAPAEIDVTLAAMDGTLRLEVRDDGRGFDVRARQRDALGLVSMEERALALGGKLSVDSAPGKGTSVLLTCPLIRRVPRPAA